MHHSEDTVRAGFKDVGAGPVGRLRLDLASFDTAWNPEGGIFTGPATIAYEQVGGAVRATVHHD